MGDPLINSCQRLLCPPQFPQLFQLSHFELVVAVPGAVDGAECVDVAGGSGVVVANVPEQWVCLSIAAAVEV